MSAQEHADAAEGVVETTDDAPAVPEGHAPEEDAGPEEDPSLTGAIEAIGIEVSAEETPHTEPVTPEGEVGPVPGITAADIPALAGCDTDAAWDAGEPCPGSGAVVAEAETEAEEDHIEAASIPPAVQEALDADKAVAEAREEALRLKEARRRWAAPTWPFAAYVGIWVLLATIAGYQLAQVPPERALYETEMYALTVLGGAVLTLSGPVLILAVWLTAKVRTHGSSLGHLFASALLKGSIATVLGVLMWWGMLVLVDYLRFGRPL